MFASFIRCAMKAGTAQTNLMVTAEALEAANEHLETELEKLGGRASMGVK